MEPDKKLYTFTKIDNAIIPTINVSKFNDNTLLFWLFIFFCIQILIAIALTYKRIDFNNIDSVVPLLMSFITPFAFFIAYSVTRRWIEISETDGALIVYNSRKNKWVVKRYEQNEYQFVSEYITVESGSDYYCLYVACTKNGKQKKYRLFPLPDKWKYRSDEKEITGYLEHLQAAVSDYVNKRSYNKELILDNNP